MNLCTSIFNLLQLNSRSNSIEIWFSKLWSSHTEHYTTVANRNIYINFENNEKMYKFQTDRLAWCSSTVLLFQCFVTKIKNLCKIFKYVDTTCDTYTHAFRSREWARSSTTQPHIVRKDQCVYRPLSLFLTRWMSKKGEHTKWISCFCKQISRKSIFKNNIWMHCEKKGKRRDSLLMTNTHSNVLISINICSIERDITSLRATSYTWSIYISNYEICIRICIRICICIV